MPNKSLPIALQLYTIRDAMKESPDGALAELAEIGFRNVELHSHYGQTPEQFKGLLDKHGLQAVSSHMKLDDVDDPTQAVELARFFGYEYIGLGHVAPSGRTPEGYRELAGKLAAAARRVRDEGLTLFYHNHAFEFEKLPNGERGYDILFNEDHGFAAEMDVCWVQKGGDDPLAWLKKLSGRAPLLHIKDMADTPEQGFAEVGTGIVPIRQLVAAAPEHGVRHLIIEQDNNWIDNQPLKSAKISFENLRKMVS